VVEAVVGRETELDAVERFLDAVPAGMSGLVLEGTPGSGKSTLWREAGRRAQARGYRVLSTRPAEAEAKLSFSGLADLLRGVEQPAFDHLPQPQREAVEIALARASGDAERGALFAGVVALLFMLAVALPLVVAVDDIQWMDVPSAAAVIFALRRLTSSRIGFLGTIRTGNEARSRSLMRALDENPLERVRVGPLSLGALHHLIKARLGRSLARPTLVRVERASGGNPFFALEIARRVLESGEPAPGEPLPIPNDVEDVIRARIRRLPGETRTALLTVASLTQPTLQHVDASALFSAEDAGLVHVAADGHVSFVHPLYASAVYRAAPSDRRRAEHRRLSALVPDLEERARHLALGASGPEEKVAATLSEAASWALNRGASDAAAELETLAIALTPGENVRESVARKSSLALHLLNIGDADRARRICEEALESAPTPELRGELRKWLFFACYYLNDIGTAYEHAEQGLAEARTRASRAEWHRRLAGSDLDVQKALQHSRKALELLDPTKEPAIYSAALLLRAMNDLVCGNGADAAAVAEGIRLQTTIAGWSSEYSSAPAEFAEVLDDLEVATSRWELVLDRRRLGGDDILAANSAGWLARVMCWRGEVIRAIALAATAVESLEPMGPGIWLARALGAKAAVDSYVGHLEDARTAALRIFSMSPEGSHPFPRVDALAALGLAALTEGDFAVADAHYSEAAVILDAVGAREPAWFRFQGDQVEAAVGVGDLEKADRMVERLEERARILPRPWTLAVGARCRGLVQAARGELDQALASLDQALVHHARLDMPFELARTLMAKGEVHRRRREKRLAGVAITEARAIFEHLGAPVWVARARGEMARVQARRAPLELTATEEEIAVLAAAGRTNREIASALFMSPKTVEKRLANVYSKLGIHTRAELGGYMAERRPKLKA
jgi:DNA-binding CsgD family transcriptional regulator